jgi:hypothetical protein
MRLFSVASSKNLADRVGLGALYTDRYIQDAPTTGDDACG